MRYGDFVDKGMHRRVDSIATVSGSDSVKRPICFSVALRIRSLARNMFHR